MIKGDRLVQHCESRLSIDGKRVLEYQNLSNTRRQLAFFVILTFARMQNWDAKRNFEENRVTRSSIDFDVTHCSALFFFPSPHTSTRSRYYVPLHATTVGPSSFELIGA